MKKYNFKDAIEKFLKINLDHKLHIENYNLSLNYPEDLLVSTYTGGASGGSYDGRRGEEFTKEDSEILSGLASSINFKISNSELVNYICVPIDENVEKYINTHVSVGKNIGKRNSDGDYYGNYSVEKLYPISLKGLLEVLLTPEDFQIFLNALPENTKNLNESFQNTETKKKIQELEKEISNFNKIGQQQKNKIKLDMDRYQKMADDLKKSLDNFDKNQTKKLKSLNDEINKIKPFSSAKKIKP